jgi:hypothetical protein
LRRASSARLTARSSEVSVAVARFHPPADARRIHLDRHAHAAVHGHGERLRAAHAAQAAGQHDPPLQAAAEVPAAAFRQGFVRSLQDPLRADVDPAAGGHLSEHDEPAPVELVEVIPSRPTRDEIGVREQHPRRVRMGREHRDRLARLDDQRLVVFETLQGAQDRGQRFPVAGGFADAAVDDQVLRPLGDFRIEVVAEHAESCFLQPALAVERGAARRAQHARCERRFEIERRLAGRRHGRASGGWFPGIS